MTSRFSTGSRTSGQDVGRVDEDFISHFSTHDRIDAVCGRSFLNVDRVGTGSSIVPVAAAATDQFIVPGITGQSIKATIVDSVLARWIGSIGRRTGGLVTSTNVEPP
jgi:hypothetical protein